MSAVCRLRNSHARTTLLTRTFDKLRQILSVTYSQKTDVLDLEAVSAVEEKEYLEQEARLNEKEIELKRNKSRLRPAHRNILHGHMPYTDPKDWFHHTVRYKRKMYGLYGEASGVNPSIAWPTAEEIKDVREYESVAFPETLQEMIQRSAQEKLANEQEFKQREEELMGKMAKLEQWKTEVNKKIMKKEADALAAKAKKDRLMEEVRRHFGYKVDTRDEKFKEMVEKKEKEEKKLAKEAKRKEREAKAMAKLVEMGLKASEKPKE